MTLIDFVLNRSAPSLTWRSTFYRHPEQQEQPGTVQKPMRDDLPTTHRRSPVRQLRTQQPREIEDLPARNRHNGLALLSTVSTTHDCTLLNQWNIDLEG
jgi:hypothetical protein